MRNRKRKPTNKKHSKKLFSKTAQRVHKLNAKGTPMRGGIRL